MKPAMPLIPRNTVPADRGRTKRFAHAPQHKRMNVLERFARDGLQAADNFFAALASGKPPESGALMAVLFHSLYLDKSQLGDPSLARNQNVTVEDFRRCVAAILESGYMVVSPAQVDAGLEPGGNYAMLTFDDGYFNNTLALDVLEQFGVPATFFISSDHVAENKAFWWDAYSREMARAGASERIRIAEINRIKVLASGEVERLLAQRFGKLALKPRSDLDRPFTPGELRDFARNRWVHVGNHTCHHAILTNCEPGEMEREIRACQEALSAMTGHAPLAVAYPNGDYSEAVIETALDAGLLIGFTTLPRRNLLPLQGDKEHMTLGRFLFNGGEDALHQCRKFSAGFIPSNALKTLIREAY
jgi:peptidoglycan/xylan/chitin deacetylase (PgdA/CDA1 family)